MNAAFLRSVGLIFPEGSYSQSPESLHAYSYDATNRPRLPDLVVFPENEEQISRLLRLCHRHRVPVTPRGAGVGFTGGSVPARGGVVLVLTKMRRILEIDTENLVAVVEPGVITGDLQDAAARQGLFYPPDPASLRTSTIGGNVAECAGGLSAVKYGVTKHYVLGVRFVMASGEVAEYGGKIIKNVSGYDLASLLVGSEGTLAVMTRFILRLLPQPETSRTFLAAFDSLVEAGAAVSGIIRQRVVPVALELMDKACLHALRQFSGESFPEGCESLLLIEVDGSAPAVEADSAVIRRLIPPLRGRLIREAGRGPERELIWDLRRSLSPAIARLGDTKINEDIVVPRSMIPVILSYIQDISLKMNLKIVCFGHAGDGNIHVNIMVDSQQPAEMQRAQQAVPAILRRAVELGGAISGEHGIGLSKKPYLHYNLSPAVMALSRRLKSAFDPRNILNPGKIFPDPDMEESDDGHQ